MAGRPRGSAGRRNSPPAPCALLTSSWRCDALRTATSSGRLRTPTPPTGRSRSGGTRQLYPAIARSLGPRCFHANLDSRRAPPPASSSPPPRPHATLTLTPPRRRPSATSSSSSRRAPSLARARLAACSSPHRAARDTLARHAAQLASCTASSARPRPHPPAYACRRPVPSPRQWERLMLNPARLYPTARLQIVRDLFFREWQARAHRSHPRPTGAAAAASAADVKSTSGMRRTPRPFPNAVRPAIPTRHHSRPRRAARAASAASCTRCTSPTSRRRRARRWPSGRRRSPTTRRSAIGRHASRSLCPRTLPPVASQDDRPSTAHRAASPSPFANTHHIAVTIPAGPATTRASASAALAHSHDAVTATSPTAPSRLQPHARRREPTTAHLRRPTHLRCPT